MSSPRLLLLSLVSTALAAETFHRKSNLTVALADVVPACAEDCFISFLDANYGIARGEEIPSLEDLCSADGNTGFTIGEGAVQCIAAEQRVGACSVKEANSYQMCSDQPGALTPTHGVITATLAVPPSGGGPVSYPAPSKTKRPFTRLRPPSTLVIDTHSPTFSPSWSPDTTLRTAVVSTTTETTATSSSTAEPAAAASGGSITPVQKAGIAVGVIGFAAVAIGLLLLFRLYRAKKKRGGHTPLASSPRRRDSWGYKFDKGRGESSSEPSWMANPVHPPNDSNHGASAAAMTGAIAIRAEAGARTQQQPQPQPQPQAAASKSPPPRAYNRSSWRPSLIGLALSPSHSKHAGRGTTTPPRPVSKLLPAKPILSLDIPKKPPPPPPTHTTPPPGSSSRNQSTTTPSPKYTRIASRPPVLPKLQIPRGHDLLHVPKSTNKPRESTMTEFEEDGRESSTVFSPESQIWSTPSAAPSSAAATCHVVDRHGNWMPGDSNIVQAAELEGTTPLSAHPKLATSMAILPVGTNGRGEQPGQGAAKRSPHRRSSSAPMPPNPAQQSIRVVTEPLTTLKNGQDNVVPRPLFSDMGGNPRNASATAAARHSFGRSLTRPRAASGDSGITNISVSSDEEHELQPPKRMSQANLSPVAESPRSGSGKSPVSYPKIPGRENSLHGKGRSAQRPRMPILYKSAHHRTASGGIGSSVAMLTVGSLAPNPNPNTPKEANNAASTMSAMAGPAPNGFKPIIPTTKVTTASPHQWASASRGPRPLQNPALLRTGSPTMRIVEPSPEPDDDRAMLPSARPRNVQSVQQSQPQRQQTRLQPSPFPASQQRSQQVATPAVEQRQEFQARSKTPAPVQTQPYSQPHQHPIQPQLRPRAQHEACLESQPQPQQQQQQHVQQAQAQAQAQTNPVRQSQQRHIAPSYQPQVHQHQIHPEKGSFPHQQHGQATQPHLQVQPLPSQQENQQPPLSQVPPVQAHPEKGAAQLQKEQPPQRDTRPQPPPRDNNPRQEKTQLQQPSRQQTQRPDAPNWIPGLPAHPHPLRRPQHTSTLWLPPQARKRNSRRKRKTIETEPDHHGQSPMRPLRRQPAHPPPQSQFQARQSFQTAPSQPQQNQQQQQQHPAIPPSRARQPIPQHQQPQDQTAASPSQQQVYTHRPQQYACPYPDPRPCPNQGPRHQYPPSYPRQQQPQGQPRPHFQQPPQEQNFQQQQQQQQQQPQVSIVAKRLGHDRAVNMSISTDCTSSASSSNNRHRASGGPMYLSPEVITPRGSSGDLPSTPTWLPRLTPTRRGADLYLNVQ
ncbi:hypothetical protein MAC_02615 [Metarhizium acridum CQMa 102]|uniref:Uncharacterized protein n=1 Tax=Metarhizium acridum (strain CQMa 102) TaxID=655827 RepID=E9DYB7_METAQ|nr:uncharacterized protein MAC_02615 [Metarhizium acridum CQMa 102]EFY91452.1 hypothetical protein MAC_02615 [Metarhizium acridum CQMa 102]